MKPMTVGEAILQVLWLIFWVLVGSSVGRSCANAEVVRVRWLPPLYTRDSLSCSLPDTLSPITDLRGIQIRVVRIPYPDTLTLPEFPADADSADISLADSIYYPEFLARAVNTSNQYSCMDLHLLKVLPIREVLPPLGDGLRAEYYTRDQWNDFKDFLLERVDTTVNFDWLAGSAVPAGPADNFSVRWTGKLNVLEANDYTLYVKYRAGQRLWVDELLVQNNWVHGETETSNTMYLSLGLHDIRLEYFADWGNARCILSWSSPNLPKQVIPQIFLNSQ